jgi:D-glycero-D-manno-heptose 1,7-bisphosphate phosphatase
LLAIRDRFGVNPVDMVVIGDSLRDLESAWAVGATAILVLTGKGAGTLARYPDRLGSTPN